MQTHMYHVYAYMFSTHIYPCMYYILRLVACVCSYKFQKQSWTHVGVTMCVRASGLADENEAVHLFAVLRVEPLLRDAFDAAAGAHGVPFFLVVASVAACRYALVEELAVLVHSADVACEQSVREDLHVHLRQRTGPAPRYTQYDLPQMIITGMCSSRWQRIQRCPPSLPQSHVAVPRGRP